MKILNVGEMKYKRKRTKKQQEVQKTGKKGELEVVKLLKKRGYRIIYSHQGRSVAGPYDIKAIKGKDRLIVEVKSGETPQIKIANFEKMLKEKGYNKVCLALVGRKYVHLLEYSKMSFAAMKASEKRKLRQRAKKTVCSRC